MPPISVPITLFSKTVYLFPSIYTPRNFICGLAVCWQLSLSSVLCSGGESSHFAGAVAVATEGSGPFVSGDCYKNVMPVTRAFGHSGGLGEWLLHVCYLLYFTEEPAYFIQGIAKVTSVLLSRCDSSVAWNSDVPIHQAASLHLCLPENWTALSLLSVSFLKVKESLVSAVDAFSGNIVGLSIVWIFVQVAEKISTCEIKVNVSFIY